MSQETQAPPRMFNILLTESELTFITNSIFQVQINSKDARLVSDLQKRLVDELNTDPASTESA